MDQKLQALRDVLPAYEWKTEEPLAKHTSFRIGGPAELVAFPRSEKELSSLIKAAQEAGITPRILGSGTNVLAPDEGVRGLVIITKDCLTGLELVDDTHIRALSGVSMTKLANFAADNGLTGLEFAHGIPGSVGGGVYMNAGAYGGEIRDVWVGSRFLHPDGTIEQVEEGDFAHRLSWFMGRPGIIVDALFRLTPGEPAAIRARMRELIDKRRSSQPLELPSAGSVFKRPAVGYAAAHIDGCGLKGLRIGGAEVSEKHAGFIVNRGGATAADVLALVEEVRRIVLDRTGVTLEPEIRLWGTEHEN